MILTYLQKKVDRLDITNVDILEEALQFKEQKEKIKQIKSQGKTIDVDKGESLEGIEEIIKNITKRKRNIEAENDENSDVIESVVEKELHALMTKYNIKINRRFVKM